MLPGGPIVLLGGYLERMALLDLWRMDRLR
jgi:hypothetical protein